MIENETAPWFNAIRSYCEPGDFLGLSDERIDSAVKFCGWNEKYLLWDKSLWKDWEKGVPCRDLDKNAYHIRYLAEQFVKNEKKWFGDLLVEQTGYVVDGHHRIRAVKYLFQRKQILIPEPDHIEIFLGRKYDPKKRPPSVSGSVAILAEIKPLMEALEKVIAIDAIPLWLTTPHPAFENQPPLDAFKRSEFSRIRQVISELPKE